MDLPVETGILLVTWENISVEWWVHRHLLYHFLNLLFLKKSFFFFQKELIVKEKKIFCVYN